MTSARDTLCNVVLTTREYLDKGARRLATPLIPARMVENGAIREAKYLVLAHIRPARNK